MHNKFTAFVSRICHSVGMPVCSEEEDMPEVNFNFCEPNVLLSEIKRVFFAKTSAEPFDDWFNPVSWNDRLSQTSTDNNAIRALTCTADKPAPNTIRKTISNDRRKVTSRTHVINVTIDEVSDANHEFVRQLKKGKKLRVWYETMGGLMFGSNAGIVATVYGDMVLNRGVGEIMQYQLEVIWESLELEQYIASPIFEDTGGSEEPPVDALMILYPMLDCDPDGVFVPSGLLPWEIEFSDGGDFVNAYALKATFPRPDNRFRAGTEESIFLGGGDVAVDCDAPILAQTSKYVHYSVPYGVTAHSMVLFSAPSDNTIMFEDVMGNTAWLAPVVLLNKNTNTILDYLHPECTVEQVYSTPLISTVRLTRSHGAINSTHFNINPSGMIWDLPGGAIASRPDPADPTNGNKLLVDFVPGTHTIGIRVTYNSIFWGSSFLNSRLYFVIEVS